LRNESVKWVNLNQVHITLSFLGDTSEDSIRDVSEMLAARCNGFGAVDLTIKGIGVFRSLSDPKVIWAGISESERLTALYDNIKGGLDLLGFVSEQRRFSPHLTLARVRSLKNQSTLRSMTDNYKEVEFQKAHIAEVIYFESIIQQTGSLYLPLKKIRL